ncbi:exodeoxyribonuclease VII large subunit [Microvirga arsenatis]|uniref:Exodeoxyribonuclease 7 large subunit n=1 Tax=Microvirga arsenatis TaxID=2692265 RepID=A0ABW9Z193_9HYPH|nr:exodeoxyribonuclease VII large subunit [Microvirga arsenatis]NBJ11207.1 exodeoxyribonuclease VII large subunit [Microvirga arsenatis]NBJ25480.1 exodeoxyribonuclease VII large subunit [Microvirga arsenatis]
MFAEKTPSNAHEWSVSDLAGALKRTLEDAFGHVRLRGEVSGYRGPHSSGHAYFCIKDQNARIDAVIWKGAFAKLRIRPEEGMEVIATGRITTFPGSSKYQIVVEALEPAGIGALMALLEERRRKLNAEGLFAPERKRRLPFLPGVIGVVTSPTGAVIRDILHRLEDRFPRRVLVWPVRVQGETCAAEVAAAIRGFNALEPGGKIPRPDVLIVARGGGSIEDLWGFNEEVVVRAAAESAIPLVSAVGHETDTTLIDHAADVRAPTPTGAAEMVVPVRVELIAAVNDLSRRHGEAALRLVERRRSDLRATARALPSPEALFSPKRQRLDLAAAKLYPALARNARGHEERLHKLSRQLAHLSPVASVARMRARLDAVGTRPHNAVCRSVLLRKETLKQMGERLVVSRETLVRAERTRLAQAHELAQRVAERLLPALEGQLARKARQLEAVSKLFDSLNYKSVLKRGFALVRDAGGQPLHSAEAVLDGQALVLEFADGKADATGGRIGTRPRPVKPKLVVAEEQGALF